MEKWKRGVTKNFRGNATGVSLNVIIITLCDRELMGLSKFIYIKKKKKKILVLQKKKKKKKKKKCDFFSRFFCE